MRYFKYQARDIRGFTCAGSLKADTEEAARTELERRRLEVLEIEEDAEASSRTAGPPLEARRSSAKRSAKLQEFLSYGMPLAAAVIALCGIPIVFHFVKPPVAEKTPVKILEDYLRLESLSQFDKQFDLLSPERKRHYASPQVYAQTRRQPLIGSPTVKAVLPGKPSGMNEIEKTARRARFEIKILRPDGLTPGEAHLVLHRGRWSVDYVRDSKLTEAALDRISETLDEEQRRGLLVELKRESGHSDLEIQDLLEKRTQSKRSPAFGTQL